jgi:hypothetical protein
MGLKLWEGFQQRDYKRVQIGYIKSKPDIYDYKWNSIIKWTNNQMWRNIPHDWHLNHFEEIYT